MDSPEGDATTWRSHLAAERSSLNGRASYDLLAVYRQAGRRIVDDPDTETIGNLIGLIVDYVAVIGGQPPGNATRSMIAKTVRRHGLVALKGWAEALKLDDTRTDKDRIAYATGCVTRILNAQTGANSAVNR